MDFDDSDLGLTLMPALVLGANSWKLDDGFEGCTVVTAARPSDPRPNQLGMTAQTITGTPQAFQQLQGFKLPAKLVLACEIKRGAEGKLKIDLKGVHGAVGAPENGTPDRKKAS